MPNTKHLYLILLTKFTNTRARPNSLQMGLNRIQCFNKNMKQVRGKKCFKTNLCNICEKTPKDCLFSKAISSKKGETAEYYIKYRYHSKLVKIILKYKKVKALEKIAEWRL